MEFARKYLTLDNILAPGMVVCSVLQVMEIDRRRERVARWIVGHESHCMVMKYVNPKPNVADTLEQLSITLAVFFPFGIPVTIDRLIRELYQPKELPEFIAKQCDCKHSFVASSEQ